MKTKKRKRMEQATLDAQLGGGTMYHVPFVASETSYEAAKAIEKDAPIIKERVYELIADHGPLTDEEIAEWGKLNPSTARPRRVQLQREGRIVESGRARTKSGRWATTWSAEIPS